MYPRELTIPMEKELTEFGFDGLNSIDQVKELLDKKDSTVLLVVNSVCGCAAGNARPGVKMSLQNEKTPAVKATVFAGVDKEATNVAREYLLPYPPSSPCIALFKEGALVHMLERHHIEGSSAQMIASNLQAAFNEYC